MKTMMKPTLVSAVSLGFAISGMLLLAACNSDNLAEAGAGEPPAAQDDELAAIMRQIDPGRIIDAIEKTPERFPIVHGMVTTVLPGTPAERFGMTPGALILERAGNHINRFVNTRGEGDLLWVDTSGELRRNRVEDGPYGGRFMYMRNLTPWYVLRGNRNPDWDHYVVAALAMHGRDPEIACRFWQSASQMGYPADSLSNLSRMHVACALGDPGQAASYARAFGPLVGAPEGLPLLESDWHGVAAITGDYSWMATAGDYFEGIYPEHDAIKTHLDIADMQMIASRDSGNLDSGSPSELAKRMLRTSILPDIDTSSPWTNNAMHVARVQRGMYEAAKDAQDSGEARFEPIILSQSPDFYHKSWCGPQDKTRDFDMTLEFTVRPISTTSPSQYLKEFHIGLANRTMHGGRREGVIPPSARILSIFFGFDTTTEAGLSQICASVPSRMQHSKLILRTNPIQYGGQGLFNHIPDHRPKPGDPQTLRVVRVGNQAEAILNGKRIALAHVPAHLDDTGVCWHISGVEVAITSFQADALN